MHQVRASALLFVVITLSLVGPVGCGDSGPSEPALTAPAAPADNDPSFVVGDLERWYLIGDAVTPGEDELRLSVEAPTGTEYVDVWLGDAPGLRLTKNGDIHTLVIDLSTVGAGDHRLILGADGRETGFASFVVSRSAPLYAILSTDWDFAEPSTQALNRQDLMHENHPELRITHFVGPYTFTDPTITTERRAELAAWLTTQRDSFDDEIGLHIHPYCNFVESAGLTCITDQSTVYADGDLTGYTIKCSAYTAEEFTTLAQHADELFMAAGLGKPVTFRAGGWTADHKTLAGLAAAGYTADTSALNWARLEEWMDVQSGELYNWNMTNWSTIGDTSQPYYPNVDNAQSSDAPTLSILEVPDNAIMVDYVSVEEMISIFEANWSGGALTEPKVYSFGFHPAAGFGSAEHGRVEGMLDHLDSLLASQDRGPVVYAVLRDMPKVWPKP